MKSANVIKGTTSLIAGTLLGGGVCIGVAISLAYYEKWRHPEDPSASSVGIVVMLTFPLGLLLGFMAGAFFADRWIKRSNAKSAGRRGAGH